VNILNLPYKGAAPSITATIGGEAHMIIVDAGLLVPHVKAGRLRALAVTSAEPSALTPGLPTVAASGLPGYEWVGMTGMWAPAKTPATIINRLNQEIVRVINMPDVKERLLNVGEEIIGGSPEQFLAAIRSDVVKTGKVIKDAGIKLE
jgi:tripartite-type tricarboxylate transporter receptor subunit TctC